MRAEVTYIGEPVGWLDWEPDGFGVRVAVDCEKPTGAPMLLRCYGDTGGQALLVGLLAPEDGRLRLRRRLTRETLKAAGCTDGPPKAFYLAERPMEAGRLHEPLLRAEPEKKEPLPQAADTSDEKPLQTGDAVLDALLSDGAVRAERQGTGVRLRCTFAPDRPFALAPAFVLCRVEGGEAVLDWTKKDAADTAASQKTEKFT